MNKNFVLLALTAAGVIALTASCSSSSGDSENGGSTAGKGGTTSSTAGTSSTSGGSASGGKSNTGGTASNTSGTANNTGGTNNTGGFNFGGAFDFGGAGFDPGDFMCDPVPKTGATCAAGTQPCGSGSTICFCNAMKWSCNDFGAGAGGAGSGDQLECPAAKPADGGDCGDTFGFCPYDQGGCACFGGTWACN